MKIKYALLTTMAVIAVPMMSINFVQGQDVGIGTSIPDFRLHVSKANPSLLKLENTTALNPGVNTEMFFKTGSYYAGGIKTIGTGFNTARLGLFTFAAQTAGSLQERMSILDNGYVGIGVNEPAYLLDVNGKIRLRASGGTAGMYLMNSSNTSNYAFVGMANDGYVGINGINGAGWNFVMGVVTGKIGIGIETPLYKLDVRGADAILGYFENDYSGTALKGNSTSEPGEGIGVYGNGGEVGVRGDAEYGGAGYRYAFYGKARNGISAYGAWVKAYDGTTNYGIYAQALGGTERWGGYFIGDVMSTGNYQGSDRKLKYNIQPMTNAMSIITRLKPSVYNFRTTEYRQMQLPEGSQYGLIADEVKQVLPELVRTATQQAEYENDDRDNGRKISDEVKYDAVNYTGLIPVMISAMQELQKMIEEQQKRIEDLEKLIPDTTGDEKNDG